MCSSANNGGRYRTLAVCAAAAFASAVWFVFSQGAPYTFDGGWATISRCSYSSGLARHLFPLFFGLLLFRLGWKIRLPRRTAMAVVTVGFLALLFVPYSIHLGAAGGRPWINGVMELGLKKEGVNGHMKTKLMSAVIRWFCGC